MCRKIWMTPQHFSIVNGQKKTKRNSKIDLKTRLLRNYILGRKCGREIIGAYGGGQSKLSRFFKSKGSFYPDDMSSIILTSFHRELNNKPINLDRQVSHYKEHWSKLDNKKKSLQQVFKDLEIGTEELNAFSGSWRYDGTDTTTLHGYWQGTEDYYKL